MMPLGEKIALIAVGVVLILSTIVLLALWPPRRRQPEHLAEFFYAMGVTLLGPACMVMGIAKLVLEPDYQALVALAVGIPLIVLAVKAIRRVREGTD